MNFSYNDYLKIKPGTDEYNQICAALFEQYGNNLKTLYLPDEATKQEKIKQLVDIVKSKNLMKTRDLENLIENIRNEKCDNEYINKFFSDRDDIKYAYIVSQIAKVCDNQKMYHHFNKMLETLLEGAKNHDK